MTTRAKARSDPKITDFNIVKPDTTELGAVKPALVKLSIAKSKIVELSAAKPALLGVIFSCALAYSSVFVVNYG